MNRCFLLALFFLLPGWCLAAEDLFEIKPVADVYATCRRSSDFAVDRCATHPTVLGVLSAKRR